MRSSLRSPITLTSSFWTGMATHTAGSGTQNSGAPPLIRRRQLEMGALPEGFVWSGAGCPETQEQIGVLRARKNHPLNMIILKGMLWPGRSIYRDLLPSPAQSDAPRIRIMVLRGWQRRTTLRRELQSPRGVGKFAGRSPTAGTRRTACSTTVSVLYSHVEKGSYRRPGPVRGPPAHG